MTHDQDQVLERPIDVKIGLDGSLYILDFGQMHMRGGQEVVKANTGRIFRLAPTASRAVIPATGQ
jgi:glucose/arabinose dehydrogenase